MAWVYKHDGSLRLPYQDNLSALIHEPTFKTAAGEAVFSKARVITQLGNQAVHSHRPIQQSDALTAVRELFHVGYWLARTYARGVKPTPGLTFDPGALPKTAPIPRQTIEQLQALETSLRERDEKLSALCWPTRRRWTRSCNGCGPKSPRRRRRLPPSRIPTTIPRPRPATTSSTCC